MSFPPLSCQMEMVMIRLISKKFAIIENKYDENVDRQREQRKNKFFIKDNNKYKDKDKYKDKYRHKDDKNVDRQGDCKENTISIILP